MSNYRNYAKKSVEMRKSFLTDLLKLNTILLNKSIVYRIIILLLIAATLFDKRDS